MVDMSHQTSKPQSTNCTSAMMQLDFARCHESFQHKTITDDTLRFLAKAAKLRMLQHIKECVKEKKRLCLLRSQILYRGAQGKSASDYLCKKLGMMSCRHVLLAFLHASLKLDALLLQRLLGAGHM